MPSVFEQIKQIAAEEGAKRDQQVEQSRQAWRDELKAMSKKFTYKATPKPASEATHKLSTKTVQEVLTNHHSEIQQLIKDGLSLKQIAQWIGEQSGVRITWQSVNLYADRNNMRKKRVMSGDWHKLCQNHDQIVQWVNADVTRRQIAERLDVPYRLAADYIYSRQIKYNIEV